MIDAIIEPVAPPAEQFRQERQAIISRHIDEIADAQQKMADNITGTKKSKEFDKFRLETSKKALVNRYFSFPYLEKYIEWDFEAFAAPVLTADDISNIGEFLNFRPRIEAIDVYIYSVFDKEFWDNLGSKYIDCPEKAEIPLSENELEIFTFYLDNIFKPAFLDIIKAMRDNKYRSLEIIHKEQNAAFNNWYDNQKDNDLEEKYLNLTEELYKTRNDFLELIRKYSKSNKFRDKLANGHGESIISAIDEQLKKVQAIYPDNLLMNSTKAAQNLGDIVVLRKGYGYNVAPKKRKTDKKEDFLVTVVFEHSNEKLVELSRPITQTDKNIMDAIETLAQTNSFITASEIYRMINGGEHIKVTPEIVAEYESRIDYMIDIKATVDYSRHMNLNGKKGEYKLKGPLLNLYKATRSLNGKKVSGYLYIAPNPVFMYAQEVNQIVSVPAALLNTKAVQKGGERANNIKFYLLFRLHTIEGQGKTISLDKILSVIGVTDPTPRQLRSIRETIENFLDLWSYGKPKTSKAAPNKEILEKSPIKGYSVNTVGKKITGYTLIPKTIVVK